MRCLSSASWINVERGLYEKDQEVILNHINNLANKSKDYALRERFEKAEKKWFSERGYRAHSIYYPSNTINMEYNKEKNSVTISSIKNPQQKDEIVMKKQIHIRLLTDQNRVTIVCHDDDMLARALLGTYRALLHNAIYDVQAGATRVLKLIGFNYRGYLENNERTLQLILGFSHTVPIELPDGITAKFLDDKNTVLQLHGYNRQQVNVLAAKIRAYRKPNPYTGKGILYSDEVVKRKQGKGRDRR